MQKDDSGSWNLGSTIPDLTSFDPLINVNSTGNFGTGCQVRFFIDIFIPEMGCFLCTPFEILLCDSIEVPSQNTQMQHADWKI